VALLGHSCICSSIHSGKSPSFLWRQHPPGLRSREIESINGLTRRLPWTGFVLAVRFSISSERRPSDFFSELFVLKGMIHDGRWLPLALFLSLLM